MHRPDKMRKASHQAFRSTGRLCDIEGCSVHFMFLATMERLSR